MKKHHKFFLKNFRGRNFETRKNFDEKPANQSFQNSQKSLPEAEKSDFSPKIDPKKVRFTLFLVRFSEDPKRQH